MPLLVKVHSDLKFDLWLNAIRHPFFHTLSFIFGDRSELITHTHTKKPLTISETLEPVAKFTKTIIWKLQRHRPVPLKAVGNITLASVLVKQMKSLLGATQACFPVSNFAVLKNLKETQILVVGENNFNPDKLLRERRHLT